MKSEDSTELDFSQTMLPTEKSVAEHDHGWSGSFGRLAGLVKTWSNANGLIKPLIK